MLERKLLFQKEQSYTMISSSFHLHSFHIMSAQKYIFAARNITYHSVIAIIIIVFYHKYKVVPAKNNVPMHMVLGRRRILLQNMRNLTLYNNFGIQT